MRRAATAPLPAAPRRGWTTAWVAAVPLALALAAVLAVLWGQHSSRPAPEPPPAVVRALSAAPGAAAERVLAATFPAADLPASEAEAVFYRFALQPGAVAPFLPGPFVHGRQEPVGEGVGAELVVAGSYALEVAAPVLVRRAATPATEETVAPGLEVLLGPGDAVTYPDYAAPADVRNDGDEPAIVVGVAIIADDPAAPPVLTLPPGVSGEQLAQAATADLASLPSTALAVGIWRLRLPPGTSFGPYETAGLEALRVEQGAVERAFLRPGEAQPARPPRPHSAGTTAPFLPPAPGVRRVVAHAGDGPAEVLALTIEPVGLHPLSLSV